MQTVAYHILHEESLKEYPKGKLQATMAEENAMMRYFEAAT